MLEAELHEWIRRVNTGEQEAFQAIYNYSKDHVFQTVHFLVGGQDACDVVNEVYAELFKSLHSYHFQKPFLAWVNGIVIRQTHNWNRRIWRRFRLLDRSKQLMDFTAYAPDAEQIHLAKERGNELIGLVRKLPFKQRIVIVLRYFHEHSLEEIAQLLDIPVGTVKSRHHTALAKLRVQADFLRKEQEESPLCPSNSN